MNILILEPNISASLSIAKFIKKYFENCYIVGCWTPTKDNDEIRFPMLNKSSDYNMYIVHEINQKLLDEYSTNSVIIPTGNISSNAFSTLCPEYRLGEIGFKKENLLAADKNYMLGICSEIDIPIPYTYGNGEEIKTFPVFYKYDHEPLSAGYRNSGIVKSQKGLSKIPKHGYLVQEYIPSSSTFGVGFIAQDGKLLTHFMHEELLSHPKFGAIGVILKCIYDPKLLEYISRLVDRLKYHGWGLAEFKYCKRRNDYVFMEINARFWASFEFALLRNPLFGKLLFGLDYPEKNYTHFVNINILLYTLLTNPVSWLKYLPQIVSGHCVIQEGLRITIYDIVRKGFKKIKYLIR